MHTVTPDCRLQIADLSVIRCRFSVVRCKTRASDRRLQGTGCRMQYAVCKSQVTAYCLLASGLLICHLLTPSPCHLVADHLAQCRIPHSAFCILLHPRPPEQPE